MLLGCSKFFKMKLAVFLEIEVILKLYEQDEHVTDLEHQEHSETSSPFHQSKFFYDWVINHQTYFKNNTWPATCHRKVQTVEHLIPYDIIYMIWFQSYFDVLFMTRFSRKKVETLKFERSQNDVFKVIPRVMVRVISGFDFSGVLSVSRMIIVLNLEIPAILERFLLRSGREWKT